MGEGEEGWVTRVWMDSTVIRWSFVRSIDCQIYHSLSVGRHEFYIRSDAVNPPLRRTGCHIKIRNSNCNCVVDLITRTVPKVMNYCSQMYIAPEMMEAYGSYSIARLILRELTSHSDLYLPLSNSDPAKPVWIMLKWETI